MEMRNLLDWIESLSSDGRHKENAQIIEFHKRLILSKTANALADLSTTSSLREELEWLSETFDNVCRVSKGLVSSQDVSRMMRECRLNDELRKSIGTFFRKSLRAHSGGWREEEIGENIEAYDGDTSSCNESKEEDDSEEDIETEEEEEEQNDYSLEDFSGVSKHLIHLNWISPHLRISLNESLYEEIYKRVNVVASRGFDRRRLKSLRKWLHCAVSRWIEKFIAKEEMPLWTQRLSFHLHDTFARSRIEDLFSIIRDFPDSEPALHDLRRCMRRTQVQKLLIQSLKTSFQKRLLHPGVSTDMIITLYVFFEVLPCSVHFTRHTRHIQKNKRPNKFSYKTQVRQHDTCTSDTRSSRCTFGTGQSAVSIVS